MATLPPHPPIRHVKHVFVVVTLRRVLVSLVLFVPAPGFGPDRVPELLVPLQPFEHVEPGCRGIGHVTRGIQWERADGPVRFRAAPHPVTTYELEKKTILKLFCLKIFLYIILVFCL